MDTLTTLSPIQLKSECELSLFQNGSKFDENKSLNKTLNFLNNMIELNYVDSELKFTNAGIDYMFQNHREFMHNLAGKDVNFGDRAKLCFQVCDGYQRGQLSTQNNCANAKFERKNLYFELSECVDYNNMVFTKNKDDEEPMG